MLKNYLEDSVFKRSFEKLVSKCRIVKCKCLSGHIRDRALATSVGRSTRMQMSWIQLYQR